MKNNEEDIKKMASEIANKITWQEMESAPKDGSRIIVLVPMVQPITSARWNNQLGIWIGGPFDNEQVMPLLWRPVALASPEE